MRGGSRPEKLGTLFFRVGLPGKTSVAGGETRFSVRGFLEGLSEKFWPHFLAFGGQIFPTDAGGKTPLTERGIPEWEQEKWLCGDLALGKTS